MGSPYHLVISSMDRCHTERFLPPQSEFRFVSQSSFPRNETPRRPDTSSNPLLHSSSQADAYFSESRSMGNYMNDHQPMPKLYKSNKTNVGVKTKDIESTESLDVSDAVFKSRPKLRIASIYEEWQLVLPVKRGKNSNQSTTLPYAMQSESSPSQSPLSSNLLRQAKTLVGLYSRKHSIDYVFEESFPRKVSTPRLQGFTIVLGALSVVVLALITRLYIVPFCLDADKPFS